MASSFPGAIDSFTDPLSNSPLNSPSHSAQHADLNDAAEKIETFVLDLPRGIVALATSTTTYALTTSVAIATGMTVTFTAVANRYYKVTYYEPIAQLTNLSNGVTTITVRPTNAAGTPFQSAFLKNVAAVPGFSSLLCTFVTTFSAGSVTLVGCGVTSSTSDGPGLATSGVSVRTLLVEDIGKV